MSSRSASPNSRSATTSARSASAANARRIARLRERIDRVDLALLRLIERRAKLAGEILALKRAAGLPARDPVREREIFARLAERSAGVLPAGEIAPIFRRILLAVRRSVGPSSRPGPRAPRNKA